MERRVHLQGTGAWRFGLFTAATLGVILAFALLLSSGLPPEVRRVISGVGLAGLGLSASFALWQRGRQSAGRRRLALMLWALACFSAAAGNLGLMIHGSSLVRHETTFSDVALLVTLSLAVAGVVAFPLARRRPTDLVRMALDGVVIGGSILAVASGKVLPGLASLNTTSLTSLAAPVIDIVVATLATLLFMRGSPSERPTLAGMALGFALYATSDLLYAVTLIRTHEFELGTPRDIGWICGYALLAWAIRYAKPAPTTSADGTPRESSAVFGTATLFAVFVSAGVVGLLDIDQVRTSTISVVLWTLVLAAVLGRQFFLVIDNEQLRQTLEQRVVERTRSLRQVTEQSTLLVNSVGDGIYGVDRYGLITFVNPAAVAALGYPPAELIGRDAHATFHAPSTGGDPFPADGCYVTEAIRDEVATSAEEDNYVRADGLQIPVEVTATPLSDDGTTLGAVVVFRDVTQRREVDRLKSEFVSVVSHELRTPLAAIRGSLGLLAGGALGPLTPTASRMVEIALVSTERLNRLINEILDLERMDAGALPMELADHSARALVDVAMGQATVLATEAGVRLRVLHVEGVVHADADRVIQTLLNLLGNAVKFSGPGQTVTVRTMRRGTFVEFEVADAGRGIPEDKLDAIFGRFEQVDSSDAREKGGSGLGLTISRSIVERLGGRIWAENNPAGGAVFRFTVPASSDFAPDGPTTGPEPVVEPPPERLLVDRSEAAEGVH